MLLYLPGPETTVEHSTLSANNIGVEYISGSTTRPPSPELTLIHNTVRGGYASVQVNQGRIAMRDDKLTGALIALDANENEYGGGFGTPSEYAPDAIFSGDYLEGTTAAVQVEPSIAALEGELTLSSDSVVGPVTNVRPPELKING